MTLLVLGLIALDGRAVFKRVAPGARAALRAALGAGPARGLMAVADRSLALVLIVVGFRGRRSCRSTIRRPGGSTSTT